MDPSVLPFNYLKVTLIGQGASPLPAAYDPVLDKAIKERYTNAQKNYVRSKIARQLCAPKARLGFLKGIEEDLSVVVEHAAANPGFLSEDEQRKAESALKRCSAKLAKEGAGMASKESVANSEEDELYLIELISTLTFVSDGVLSLDESMMAHLEVAATEVLELLEAVKAKYDYIWCHSAATCQFVLAGSLALNSLFDIILGNELFFQDNPLSDLFLAIFDTVVSIRRGAPSSVGAGPLFKLGDKAMKTYCQAMQWVLESRALGPYFPPFQGYVKPATMYKGIHRIGAVCTPQRRYNPKPRNVLLKFEPLPSHEELMASIKHAVKRLEEKKGRAGTIGAECVSGGSDIELNNEAAEEQFDVSPINFDTAAPAAIPAVIPDAVPEDAVIDEAQQDIASSEVEEIEVEHHSVAVAAAEEELVFGGEVEAEVLNTVEEIPLSVATDAAAGVPFVEDEVVGEADRLSSSERVFIENSSGSGGIFVAPDCLDFVAQAEEYVFGTGTRPGTGSSSISSLSMRSDDSDSLSLIYSSTMPNPPKSDQVNEPKKKSLLRRVLGAGARGVVYLGGAIRTALKAFSGLLHAAALPALD